MTGFRIRFRCAAAIWLALASVPAAATPTRGDFDRAAQTIKGASMRDPITALSQADRAEALARALSSQRDRDEALASVQQLRGEAYIQMGRIDTAAPLLKRALAFVRSKAPGTKAEAEILMSLGGVVATQGEPAAAFGGYQAAHTIFRTIGDTRDQALVLLYISALYGDANDYAAALKYLDQAIAADHGDQNLLLSIYNNRASNLQELGRYAEAEAGYRKALILARQMDSTLLQARILGNIARVRLKVGDVAGAQKALGIAQTLAQGTDAAAARLQLTAIAAQAAFQRHDYRQAAALIGERFAGVDLTTTTISSREAHQTAYETYRALGDAPRAVVHLVALKRLDDKATRLATSAGSALAAARFDSDNQKLRIRTLQLEDANRKGLYERQRAHTERLIFLGVAASTAIIIALLGFWLETLRRSRNRVRAAADDLAVTNAALGKALAAKTEFLATTSHEIRTPLNGILGMTQVMLADPRLAAETRDRIGVVHGAGVTMRALVDDILDVAKMETGNLTVEHAPFDLAATLAEAAKLWAEQARGKGIDFRLDLSDCPGWIEGDAARVRQIAFNLLSNALKFTASGHVALRATRDGEGFRIAVADSGIGIAGDKIEDIFESFRQADAGTTRQFGGTGLGLAICRNLARAMGGEVAVDSVPGTGSTFTVTLPLVEAERASGAQGDTAARAEGGGVVIVDANPITRAMLKTLIASRCSAVAVASLAEAIEMAGDADLVLIDQSALATAEAIDALVGSELDHVTVLWRGEVPDAVAAKARVVAKPIGGPALLAALFDTLAEQICVPSLVQRAA